MLFWFQGFVFCPSFVFPYDFVFGTFGSLAGIAPCSFVLPRLGFVINLFFILLSGRSAVGNMPVADLKPHVLGELELGICFNLSIFDILSLSWKATEISSFSLSLDFLSFFSIFMVFRSCLYRICLKHSGTLFCSGVSTVPWRSNPVYSLASSLHCAWAATTPCHRRLRRASGFYPTGPRTSRRLRKAAPPPLHWALELNTPTVQTLPHKTWAWTTPRSISSRYDDVRFIISHSARCSVWDRHRSANFGEGAREGFLFQKDELPDTALSRSFCHWKALCVDGHCFNRAFMPVSLQSLTFSACMPDKQTNTPKYFKILAPTRHTTQTFFTPFRPKVWIAVLFTSRWG